MRKPRQKGHAVPVVPSKSVWMARFRPLAKMLERAASVRQARVVMRRFMEKCDEERALSDERTLCALEYHLAMDCLGVLRRILSPRSERLCGFSVVKALWDAARSEEVSENAPGEGFWLEMVHLFAGAVGESGVYDQARAPLFLQLHGREAGRERSDELDRLAKEVRAQVARYRTGLERSVVKKREANRRRVLAVLGACAKDWQNYRWHLNHIIRDAETLGRIVQLTDEERTAIEAAKASRLPFAVTPYYAALMDRESGRKHDHAARAGHPPVELRRCIEERATSARGRDGFHRGDGYFAD